LIQFKFNLHTPRLIGIGEAVIKVEVFADAGSVAREAAAIVAAEARAAIAARGSFVLAVSGGRTPWLILRALILK